MNLPEVLVEFDNIEKSFGTASGFVKALDQVSFQVRSGSIHAIIGENGAGKSTLMKILFGLYQADQGQIKIFNQKINWSSSLEARKFGIGMVHQHFMLAESETALDNVALYALDLFSKNGLIQREKLLLALEELKQKTGMTLDWSKAVCNLSVGEQQRLEIIKAIIRPTKLLIMDEPTAVLSPHEVQGLLDKLIELKNSGVTILLITHKLKEVMSCADYASILRGGKLVGTKKISETTEEELAFLMIGAQLPPLPGKAEVPEKEIVKLDEFHGNLILKTGDILGVAGVEGNGQTEFINSLLHKNWEKIPVCRMAPDRLRQSIIGEFSLVENMLLSQSVRELFTDGFTIKSSELVEETQNIVKKFDVRPALVTAKIENLSGGNQQKFVAGRELATKTVPQIALVAHPTRGVDFGASQLIRDQILNLRNQGTSIVLLSSDVSELLTVADRIIVMVKGAIKGPYLVKDLNETKLGMLMGGIDVEIKS